MLPARTVGATHKEEDMDSIDQIKVLFEKKIKRVEEEMSSLKQHRDRTYAQGHLVENYDRELFRMREKYDTLTALYQEIQNILEGNQS
jgi:hypothetical protein